MKGRRAFGSAFFRDGFPVIAPAYQPADLVLAVAALPLGGCAVVTVAGTAVSVAAAKVGLAADAIGTAWIAGKAVGAAADAVLPGLAAP